ncbi:MAG: polysaccharide biosynthesis C-terminal domain-containing protein, partial [Erysipelotrichaceae bacterium]|nr:polysaccharide biosynthesis C-terminal domain-containing protein [Erysipelotrichaceae bacterium]
SMIVGNYVSKEALSAVSACSSILQIANFFFYGVSTACGILTSTSYGANDKEKLNNVVQTSLIVSVAVGIGLTTLGEVFTPQLMAFSNITGSIYPIAEKYLRIYMLGNVFVFLYNISFFILRSMGDSRSPLYYLMMSCGLNIVLGVIFVRYINLSVVGVALATIISQMIVVVFALRLLMRMKDVLTFDWKHMHINWPLAQEMARLGIPAAIQNMLLSLPTLLYSPMSTCSPMRSLPESEWLKRWPDGFRSQCRLSPLSVPITWDRIWGPGNTTGYSTASSYAT